MPRPLDRYFLDALKKEFPFLQPWEPMLHTPERPVEFDVKRELSADVVWRLELGRYNNQPTYDYHFGITAVWTFTEDEWVRHSIQEGETRPADILPPGTLFVLVCNSYRSQLVYNDPGRATWTLYKNGQRTVEALVENAEDAARMSKEALCG